MTKISPKFPARALAMAALAIAALVSALGNASARTLAEVKSLGAISMCANDDALPYASNKPGLPGFQVEIGRAIAEGLGLPLNVEWILARRRANIVNCDMMLDVVNDPEVHEGKYKLSRPYQRSGLALGLGKGAEPISSYTELKKGQKIGVMVGSFASMVLGKADKSTSPYAFQADMLEELARGDLYGAAASAPSLSYYILKHPDSGLTVVNAFDDEAQLAWDVSVGLRKSDQALVDAVNKVLDKLIADGTLTAIYARYGVQHRLP